MRYLVLLAGSVALFSASSCSSTGNTSGNVAPTTPRSPSPSVSRSLSSGAPPSGGTFEARALIAPAVPVKLGATRVPLTSLGFPIPSSEEQISRLTATQRSALLAALRTTDCGATTAHSDHYRTVCTQLSGATFALLTGPRILGPTDLAAVNAVAPNAGLNGAEWSLEIDLTSSGAHDWSVYTSGHNVQGQQGSFTDFTNCEPASGLPCADFVALIAGNRAPLVPVNQQPVNDGRIQVAGGLTRASAMQLASTLRS